MSEYQGIFKRYEKKYLINDEKYKLLSQKLYQYFKVDDYGRTTICNIYFDTPDYRLIRASKEAPVYKEKLRLRSYGIPREGDKVFIELKKKYKGIVYKRRVKAELNDAVQYLYWKKQFNPQTQITKEIDWFINHYEELIPAMYISYNRVALYGREDNDLRITFDNNILWREEDLWLQNGIWGRPLLKQEDTLMEIKIPGAMPIWLSHTLDELEIYPTSFSKYGRGYDRLLEQKINNNIIGEMKYA